jgi:hypothetical protein
MHAKLFANVLATSALVSEAFSPQTLATQRGLMPASPIITSQSSFFNNRHRMIGTASIDINSDVSPTGLYAKKKASLIESFTATAVGQSSSERRKFQIITLIRVGLPSLISGIASFFAFPALALLLASIVNDAGVFAVLSQDSSQFVQNFLTVSGLLFSILIGQTYAFLYTQQEAVFYALFDEVTEAKSLLEQVALVCQGRSMYGRVLDSISKYVQNDLKQLKADPAVLISARPVDDPLESIMYLTSVGVPSSVYDTVRSLRQARAARLGALQRKLPKVHFILLWILAVIELISFPLLGAGTQSIGGYNILTVEGVLFGVMTFGIVMTMKVISELNRPGGGAYTVDGVLNVMVKGLEQELTERMAGGLKEVANQSPSLPNDTYPSNLPTLTSGGSMSAGKELMRKAIKPLKVVKDNMIRSKQ